MKVIKRNGKLEVFDSSKIITAIQKAFQETGEKGSYTSVTTAVLKEIKDHMSVESIQDIIEKTLMEKGFLVTAKSFILYREQHKNLRETMKRVEYIDNYIDNGENAATSSEVDDNANIQNKNVATLDAEVHKKDNTLINRYRITKKLKEMYGEKAPDYVKDLKSHIIYKHDEHAFAKPYCVAVNLFPFMQKGTSSLDGLNSCAPKNLTSFVGQFTNLTFLLSSQFAGAVAFGEFFNVFNYYCVKEFGENYYKSSRLNVGIKSSPEKTDKVIEITISDRIKQAFQGIVYSLNQPAGNRSFQSPFSNFSYYDSNYWNALFKDFVYPDGTKPEWEAIDFLQRKFMKWFNAERKKCLLTFPVETMALLSDGKDKIKDSAYEDLTAEMYAEGHSFFTYISDKADSLSSCCRVLNKLDKNTFNFTNGLTGVATGSKSVITLNLNRIVQDYSKLNGGMLLFNFNQYLSNILKRVYKYHSAFNELLWHLYDKNMLPVYKQGYISLNQQFLTIGINGLNEAAEFLNIKVGDNDKYEAFCRQITSTIGKCNREAEQKPFNPKHKLKFNTEMVPAESLAIKNYNWDKEDGYIVPDEAIRNCYNSYFYEPEKTETSILEKFRLHGRRYVDSLDGGVALHCNLDEHLSKKQYAILIKYAIKNGTNYFTFNIPNSQCDDCGYISKSKIDVCPKCGSKNITWWTRIIGYLRPIKAFSSGRKVEASRRVYKNGEEL